MNIRLRDKSIHVIKAEVISSEPYNMKVLAILGPDVVSPLMSYLGIKCFRISRTFSSQVIDYKLTVLTSLIDKVLISSMEIAGMLNLFL